MCFYAQVHAALGKSSDAFLDLQRLCTVSPEYPGLFELLRHAAQRAQREQGGAMPSQVTCLIDQCAEPLRLSFMKRVRALCVCCKGDAASGCMVRHLRELGLDRCASQAGVRQAYKQGAARWHPDKWMHASPAEQASAEQRFLRVQQAYEALVQAQ